MPERSIRKDHESAACPAPKQLLNWLEGRANLSQAMTEHVRGCQSCLNCLDELTSAKDLREFAQNDSPHSEFDDEPEQRALKDLVAAATPEAAVHTADTFPADVDSSLPENEIGNEPTFSSSIEAVQQRLPSSRYRLHRQISAGGAGIVFLAFDDELKCDVAIKILLHDTQRNRTRLEREARILAEINHPNVVRIFDIGYLKSIAEAGVGPMFLVMEYVSGGTASSLRVCGNETNVELQDLHAAFDDSYTQIARLMASAADGLAEAHARGLVHRDVKPANLLLDETRTRFKVADFGLAQVSAADVTHVTRSEDILGTPSFMSPEQTQPSKKVDHLADVYGLGATLYSVISGTVPFHGTPMAILRQVADTEPLAPRIHNADIPQDLETICIHAMQKAAKDRYQTIELMAADLRRFAAGEAIVAKPPTSVQRLGRFLKQNRSLATAIATSITLATVLFVAIVISAVLFKLKNEELRTAVSDAESSRIEAEEALRKSIDAADQLLVSVASDSDYVPRSPGAQKASIALLNRAKAYLNTLVTSNESNPILLYQLARAHAGLAEIASRLSDSTQVEIEAESALKLIEKLQNNEGNEEEAGSNLQIIALKADILLTLANYHYDAGRAEQAIQYSNQIAELSESGLPVQDALNEHDSRSAGDLRSTHALSMRTKADAQILIGRIDEAMPTLEEAQVLFAELRAHSPDDERLLRDSALVYMTLATTAIDRGQYAEGKASLNQAKGLLSAVSIDSPAALRIRELVGVVQTNIGLAERHLGNTQAAKEAYMLAIDQHSRLVELEPMVSSHKWNLVTATLNSGGPDFDLGNLGEVVGRWQGLVPVLDSLIAAEPETLRYMQVKAMLQSNIAIVLRDMGQLEEALRPLRDATAVLREYSTRMDDAPEAYYPVAVNHFELASTFIELGRYAEAEQSLDASDSVANEIIQEHPDYTVASGHLLDSLLARFTLLEGRAASITEKASLADQTLTLAQQLVGAHPDTVEYHVTLPAALINHGSCYLENGDHQEAKRFAIEAIDHLVSNLDAPLPSNAKEQQKSALILLCKALKSQIDASDDRAVVDRLKAELKETIDQAIGLGAREEEVTEFRDLPNG